MKRRKGADFIRSKGPIAAFALITLVGCVFIWVSKFLGWDAFIVTGIPVLLMLAYLGMSFVADGLRLHDEQTGDNLYYMGFLFTLSSLGASLYQFTAADSIDAIVRNFGVAIASTIVGIALRILYNQMRRDPLDVERTTRHELAEMTRRVRAELDSASREFSSFRRVSNQMLQEGFDEIARQAERSGEQIQKSLESVTSEAVKPIKGAAEKLNGILEASASGIEARLAGSAERMEAASGALEQANSKMADTVTQFGSHVESAGTKLAGLKTPDEILKIQLAPVLTTLGKIVVEHGKKLESTTEEQRAQFAQVRATFEPVEKIISGLERSVAASEKSVEAMNHSVRAAENLSRMIQQQNTDMQKFLQALSAEKNEVLAGKIADGVAARINAVHDQPRAVSSVNGAGIVRAFPEVPHAGAPRPVVPVLETENKAEEPRRSWRPW
ncbi:hypothetical protein [Mesorhizobium sp.]|uniref:hypothetical protein n=1 Tax=Mesorhizobium sp. TaxID=1871066 RepID=UPI000FE98716|nr:hypothetical protein [Mesorhizobium sp.]RWL18066.1 MAG: hypothetical protein EOR57_22120 [Mesorhizobium sp.]TIP70758.1 MAG: hypothetical protein E5X55_26055 [Mesorhizobium sp.]TIQ16742.1 MAG: hypothetical protein E5X51_33730 [Mesorhizobium sp.]TJV95456.1 MAG: hypothetical protein E5X52_24100 [Mesorhizobium sp.]